jgi:hypothetical protein
MAEQRLPAGWGARTAQVPGEGNGEQVAFNGAAVAVMLIDGDPSIDQIRERLGVSRATAYRYVRAAKAALQEVRGA